MLVNGQTRVLGIFGDPVEHTLSPGMQNAVFEANHLNWIYLPFHVKPGELKKAVAGIKAFDMLGVNVTIPHKEKVVRHLDEVDGLANVIGAVNTIVNVEGRLIGYNTDGYGYVESLREETGFDAAGKNIVILGAGGAGRAILFTFLYNKKNAARSVVIANRTLRRAKRLVDEFKDKVGGAPLVAASLDKVDAHLAGADILINATSVGMMGKGEVNVGLKELPGHAIVSDIVYRPLETTLLKKAKARGLKIHGGLGMLAHQGALSFELFTLTLFPRPPLPIDIMKRAAIKALGTDLQ
ncbi:MAG: shikimate dehydrogenase [Deltaproteobacteria bacterium]|nr:shikimate dehydrogenase [Deltaproteobacteria bacterium]